MVYDKQLTTVRIIAVNLEKHGLNETILDGYGKQNILKRECDKL